MVLETKVIPSRPTTTEANPNQIQIVTLLPGNEFYRDAKTTSIPGTTQVLFSYTVPASNTLYCSTLFVTHRQAGCWELKADSDIIAAGNTGAGHLDSKYQFNPVRPLAAGVVISLEFKALASAKAITVHGFFSGGLKTN